MHSSWKLWDFLKSRPEVIDEETPALLFINSFNPFATRILKDRIPLSRFSEEKLNVKLGKELTSEWVEENFKTLSLFGGSESYYIIHAHEMPEKVKSLFKQPEDLMLDNRYIIFDYAKDDGLTREMKKSQGAEVIKLTPPAFWEKDQLLTFLNQHLSVFLSYDAKEYFIKHVEFSLDDYFNYLTQLKLNYPHKKQIDLDDLGEVVYQQKWDQFEITEFFATKKYKQFFSMLSKRKNFEDIRMIAQFLQSHMIKVFDPSYTEGKPRLTKYDREILKQHDLWSAQEISRAMSFFISLEHKAKSKDPSLFTQLNRDFLKLEVK